MRSRARLPPDLDMSTRYGILATRERYALDPLCTHTYQSKERNSQITKRLKKLNPKRVPTRTPTPSWSMRTTRATGSKTSIS